MERKMIVDMLGAQVVDLFDNALEKIAHDIDGRNIDVEKVYWLAYRVVGLIFPYALRLQAEKEYWRRLARDKSGSPVPNDAAQKAYSETMKEMFSVSHPEQSGFGAISLYISEKVLDVLKMGDLLTEDELHAIRADHAVEHLFAEADVEEMRRRFLKE